MGLLSAFTGEDADANINALGSGLGAIGAALASSPSNNPLQNLPQTMQLYGRNAQAGMSRTALKALLIQAGYSEAEATQYSASEGTAKMALQQKQQQKVMNFGADEPSLIPGEGAIPAMSPAAPPGPAAGVSLNGGTGGLTGSQADKAQAWYSEAIKQGATPLEAAAMVGNFTVENGLNTTGKPGDNGTAFGGGQWREERAANLRKLAQDRGESWDSVPVQVAHTLNELKGGDAGAARARALIAQAKTPEEAAGIFAQHFERPSKDALAATLGQRAGAAAQAYKMFGQGTAPTRIADASGAIPVGAPSRLAGVQIADNEQQTQALEGRMGMYPSNVYGITPETQAGATSQADMPAADAQPAGFVIPPGVAAGVQKSVGTPPPPVENAKGVTTQQALANKSIAYWQKALVYAGSQGEAGKGLVELAKFKMDLAKEFLKPNYSDNYKKLVESGYTPGTPEFYQASRELAGLNKVNADFEQDPETGGIRAVPGGNKDLARIKAEADARRDPKAITEGDKTAIREADAAAQSSGSAVEALREAKTLSAKAYAGPYASRLAYFGSFVNAKGAKETLELDNLVQSNALSQMKAIFGANPTEGERKILLEIQGSSSQPDTVRQSIFDRGIKLAEERLAINARQAKEMRAGTYYSPGSTAGDRPAAPAAAPQQPAPAQQQSRPPARTAPAVGTIQRGYRFLGGDPANPASWERATPGQNGPIL